MKRVLSNLWTDDCGALLATEWVVLATIIVFGIIPGLVAIRNSTLKEMVDFSNATNSLDQSYEFDGEEIFGEDALATTDDATRHGFGGGSITDIFPGGATSTRKTKGNAHDDDTVVEENRQGTTWKRHGIAWTAGSRFIQANHTSDGKEVSSSTKHLRKGALEAERVRENPADACD